MPWVPLSRRSGEKPAEIGPHEGVPEWLVHSLSEWCRHRIYRSLDRRDADDPIGRIERKLKLALPSDSISLRLDALMERVKEDEVLFIDLVELLLSEIEPNSYSVEYKEAVQLAGYLDEAGSLWTVAKRDGAFTLERRVESEVAEAAELAIGEHDRPGQHLRLAWEAVYGRHKDTSTAYREAVRAVEAVAKPSILPNDPGATLGKMIAAIRDAPRKWEFALQPKADDSVDIVRAMMALLWTSQLDRHGTDDESEPLSVSDEEAESAVHLAVTLVHWFRTGAFRRSVSES